MCKQIRIAAVGDNCMDVYDSLPAAFPGGNPVNVAVYTVRLGGEASYTGVVGTDQYGPLMVNALAEKGVDVSHLHTATGKTAVSHVELLGGDRIFGDYEPGVMERFRLTAEDIDFLCSYDLVVTGLWGMVEGELHKIRARGVPVAFDCANRPNDPIAVTATPHTDYLFFSYDEGTEDDLRALLQQLHNRGPRLVVATRGALGSLAWDGAQFYEGGIVPCPVVDTMGAGDSYIAGFLYALLQGHPVQECMALGAKNSSVTLQYNGAW